MNWSKEWPSNVNVILPEPQLGIEIEIVNDSNQPLTVWPSGAIIAAGEKREYKNKVPTHDPYANPNIHIYYECACGAILDPGTKSFAALNNAAMNAGWKVRWGAHSYQPYCVKCGEDVE